MPILKVQELTRVGTNSTGTRIRTRPLNYFKINHESFNFIIQSNFLLTGAKQECLQLLLNKTIGAQDFFRDSENTNPDPVQTHTQFLKIEE